jgi:hypothetical protein
MSLFRSGGAAVAALLASVTAACAAGPPASPGKPQVYVCERPTPASMFSIATAAGCISCPPASC